ncbi:MAG: cation transporter [Clostridia bacterium]|nr:cation transporter [Clostridia bacterium]
MTNWLIRRFVRGPDNTADPDVRYAYGRLAGGAGIAANILLFAVKLLAGILAGSLSIIADGFNNLSDAGSSVVTLIGFKLSSAPPDEKHPFGHGRMEYLSALAVAAMIMIAGFELFTSAIDKILHPTPTEVNLLTLVILAAAIAVKLWMALFFRRVGERIDSESLKASATDSRNDVLCTGVVFVTSLLSLWLPVSIDGYVGVAVALFVLWAGFSVMRETVSPLLGQAPEEALVADVKRTVMAYDGVVGVHDLMIHNYGPGRMVMSLHAEVPCQADILQSHDLIDRIERDMQEKYRAVVCIHMDPVDFDNPEVARLRAMVAMQVAEMDEGMTIHDFRVVFGQSHTNLIFDLVVPFGKDENAAAAELSRRVQTQDPTLFTVITVEHAYA